MEFYKNHIEGFMNERELIWLYEKAIMLTQVNPVVVELGSWHGRSAFSIANGLAIKDSPNLVCIDTWVLKEGKLIDPDAAKVAFQKTVEEIKKLFAISVRTIDQDTWAAAEHFPDETVDMIFIDAGHDYNSVIEDLSRWVPKVKVGGLICGHDYVTGRGGVVKAVNKFFGKGGVHKVAGTSIWETRAK